MSSTKKIEQLRAEAGYYHDRVAVLRATLYTRAPLPTRIAARRADRGHG